MDTNKHESEGRLDLERWRKAPALLMGIGGLIALIGIAVPRLRMEFAYAWLLGFMFFLSLCLGALFLVIVHHLFDAGWSVPIRRFCEHIASLLVPWMVLLFLPIAFLAKRIYPWMGDLIKDPKHIDHALKAKAPLFTIPMFYVISGVLFAIWFLLSNRLRYW